MTFTSGIPTTGQSLGATKNPIQNNFTNYNTVVSQDHVAPNATGQGKHNKSTYVVQSGSPLTAVGEADVYSKLVSGVTQLFVQKENQSALAADIQTTRLDTGAKQLGLTGTLVAGGYTYLPGGFIMQFGYYSAPTDGAMYTFPIPFPGGVLSLNVSAVKASNSNFIGAGARVVPPGTNVSTFNITLSGQADYVSVIAIGF